MNTTRKTKYRNPLSFYATRYGVSISTIKRWSAAGWNLDDASEISAHIAGQKHAPENFQPHGGGSDPGDEAVKVLEFNQQIVDSYLKRVLDNPTVQGLNQKQSKEFHRNAVRFALNRFWKQMILVLENGETFEAVKHETGDFEEGK